MATVKEFAAAKQITAHHHTEGVSDVGVYELVLSDTFPYRLREWRYVGPQEWHYQLLSQPDYVACYNRDQRPEDLADEISSNAQTMRERIPGYHQEKAYREGR